MGIFRPLARAACIVSLGFLTACVTSYKPPATGGPTAKLDFAYIELGDKPGSVSITSYGKGNVLTGPDIRNIGKLTPAAGKTPETVEPQLSIVIPAGEEFNATYHFASTGKGAVLCPTSFVFTPAADASYLAVFFNKANSCHPALFRRTPQGLAPQDMGKLPLPLPVL